MSSLVNSFAKLTPSSELVSYTLSTLQSKVDLSPYSLFSARIKNEDDANHIGLKIIPEISVKDDGKSEDLDHVEDIVTILSTYKSRNVGTNCQNIADQTGNVCQRKRGTDLAKLAIFATHLKNSWGKCIHEYASDCNRQIKDSIVACKRQSGRKVVNFIQSDYPNYAPNGQTNVQVAYGENMAQVQRKQFSSQDQNSPNSKQQNKTKKTDFEGQQKKLENKFTF